MSWDGLEDGVGWSCVVEMGLAICAESITGALLFLRQVGLRDRLLEEVEVWTAGSSFVFLLHLVHQIGRELGRLRMYLLSLGTYPTFLDYNADGLIGGYGPQTFGERKSCTSSSMCCCRGGPERKSASALGWCCGRHQSERWGQRLRPL